jgi:hypothetical protein
MYDAGGALILPRGGGLSLVRMRSNGNRKSLTGTPTIVRICCRLLFATFKCLMRALLRFR